MMAEYDDVIEILKANASKSFVKRVLYPSKYPTLDLGGGNYATHKMAWAEVDGKYRVFPTVMYDGKALHDYGKNALPLAIKSGNYIDFDDAETAEWFSTRYKLGMGK